MDLLAKLIPVASVAASLMSLLVGGCRTIDGSGYEVSEASAARISVSLVSNEPGGIFVLDQLQRKATQIKAITSDEAQIKYSFAKRPQSTAYDFVYSPEGGAEKGVISRFTFDLSSFSSGATETLSSGLSGFANGPSLCARQNKVAFVTINSDSTSVSALDLSGSAGLHAIVVGPKQMSADLSCENLSQGVAYAHYPCSSSSLAVCGASENTLAAIYRATEGAPPVQLTFPELDPRIIQSPGRPIDNHLGDIDSRALESPEGNFLVFQRIFTTPSLFNGSAPIDSEYGHNGFMAAYYKEIGEFSSPNQREFRLSFDSWVLSHYPQDQQSHVEIKSIMGTSDIRIPDDEPSKIDVLMAASMTSPSYEYNGILRGQFDRTAAGNSDTINVGNITSVLDTREFACGVWAAMGGVLDSDGNIYVFMEQFPRLMEDGKLVSFSSRKVKILPNAQIPIVDVDGVKSLKINGQNIPVEQWRSMFCGGG